MNKLELQKLIKVEDRLNQLAKEKYGLEYCDIEWDVIPDQKMLEIMAYHIPGNISNWKYGRDYERLRTINEHVHSGLPYEVVINSDPARAYLMKSNTFGVQCLVMAHVIGHVAFFTMNKYFKESRRDIISYMQISSERIAEYERKYGIDDVEKIVDAGHAIQFHSSPFDNETEDEKRLKLFNYSKRKFHKVSKSEFRDIMSVNEEDHVKKDIEWFNQTLWKKLCQKKPVEPTGDLLRYIIDNSENLMDWEKDILEVLRQEGRYYWPQIKTKYMNEGFATYWHQILIKDLINEEILDNKDHAEFNYANSLVKAMGPTQMNPYLIGCEIWEDIVDRWNKGKHGREYENCESRFQKENWDTKDGLGHEKMMEVMKSYTDWFFVQDFLTPEMVEKLKLYIYVVKDRPQTIDIIRTKHSSEEISKLIINSFAHSHIPNIEVTYNGNMKNNRTLWLVHKHSGADLDLGYAQQTLKHISTLWGNDVTMETIVNEEKKLLSVSRELEKKNMEDFWSTYKI
jgi:stage V sporulation protein R